MNRSGGTFEAIGVTLPVALALVLPFGAFGCLPLSDTSLTGPLLLLMAAGMLLAWNRSRLLRPPFEYWGPTVALLPLIGLSLWHADGTQAAYLMQSLVAFLAPLALASNGAVACRALGIFGVASALAILLHGAAAFAWIPPTVVDIERNIVLAGPDSLKTGMLLSATGLMVNLLVIVHPAFSQGQRRVALLATVVLLLGWGGLLLGQPNLRVSVTPLSVERANLSALALSLILLWLAARIMARSLYATWQRGAWQHAHIAIAVGFIALLYVGLGAAPSLSALFVLGLLAALDAPWTVHRPQRYTVAVWSIPMALLLLQLGGFFSMTEDDPRNQVARGERLLAAEDWEHLDGTLACLLERDPGDVELSFLQARSLLAQEWPEAAVDAFVAVPRPVPKSAQLQRQYQSFLDDLRDRSSAQAPGHARFYFERALLHIGDREQVENLLDFRRGRHMASDSTTASTEVLSRAVESLLGASLEEGVLSDWSAEDLGGILQDGEVVLARFPEGIPPQTGPILLDARRTPAGMKVGIFHLLKNNAETFFLANGPSQGSGETSGPLQWIGPVSTAQGQLVVSLEVGERRLATIRLGDPAVFTTDAPAVPGASESNGTILYVP